MTKKHLNSIVASIWLGSALIAGGALPAFAQDASATKATSSVQRKEKGEMKELRATNAAEKASSTMLRAKEKANKEIDRRIEGLNKLVKRVDRAKKLTDTQKTALAKIVQDQIGVLTALKAKIAADTDLVMLRADVQSITKAYRIYALVLPQIEVIAAADRALTIVDTMTTLGAKLQARITEMQNAGKDVAAFNASMTDFNAMLADAKVQAQAAIDLVLTLTPDNGDQAKFEANRKALQDARTKVRAANKDLSQARHDANEIRKSLKDFDREVKRASSTREKADKDNDEGDDN